MEYAEYINSKRWQRRRMVYFWRHEKKCAACGNNSKIHLHHMSYEYMGQEPDGDLIALCEWCHTKVHQMHQRPGHSKTLRQATMAYIAVKQEACRQKKAKKARRKPKTPKAQRGPLATAELRARQKAFVPANRRGDTPEAPGGNRRLSGLPIVVQPKTS